MNAPDKIYLHPDIGGREFIRPWLHRAANSESVAYIRKDALLEKLNRARELRIKGGQKESSDGIRVIDALTDLINKL